MPVKRTQSQRTRKAARTSKKRTATDAFGVGKGFALSSDHRILTKTSSVVMRYADSVTLNPGISGIPATVVLRANGMFDPDAGIGGHQPKGFDQLMAMYEHYHVDECLLEVWADAQDLTTSQLITLSVNRSPSPIVTRNDVLENRMASTYALAASQGGPAATYQRISVNPDKFLGMKSKDDTTWGSDTANPFQQVYFHATAMPVRETDSGEVYLTFKLTYKCTLREPKSVISS